MSEQPAILLAGGAGFVGQNLLQLLKKNGYSRIIVLDKNHASVTALKAQYREYNIEHADLSDDPQQWKHYFKGVHTVVMLQAQIGGHGEEIFIRNNITSTSHVLDAIREHGINYIVHVSSSVVTQASEDTYSRTKKHQEDMVIQSGISCVILRPTLMFGNFNVNHFAWLAKLMKTLHLMPVPGNGRYIRQPLYVDDFCQIILRCLQTMPQRRVFNISGLESVYYIDCLKKIRRAMGIFCPILPIPYPLFSALIKTWALLCRSATFNAEQLQALTAGDVFETIDWPGIFNIQATPLDAAIDATFSARFPT